MHTNSQTSSFARAAFLADVIDVVDVALAAISRRVPDVVSREDLASVGKLALLHALESHESRGPCAPTSSPSADTAATTPFAELRAYCFVRVRGAMLDELRRLDPLSRRQRAFAPAVASAAAVLEAQYGRAPTDREIAALAGLGVADVTAVRTASRMEEVLWDCVPDAEAASPAECVESADLHACLRAALARLPANQAHALRRYYLDDATLDDIAAELGVSRERARQVREAGEKKLRADLVVLALWQAFITRQATF